MRQKQSGNVLFIILIATALFAGLSYAVTQGGKAGSGDGVTRDKARLVASELIQYTTAIEQAVNRLMMVNDCDPTEISFDDPSVTGYVNANAPADKSCHVFHVNGGGVSNKDNYYAELTGDTLSYAQHGNGSDLQDVGISGCGDASCTELYTFHNMRGDHAAAVCEAVNRSFGHTDLIPTPTIGYLIHPPKFTGSFTETHAATGALFRGKTTFCYNYNVDTSRYFYVHVLLAR